MNLLRILGILLYFYTMPLHEIFPEQYVRVHRGFGNRSSLSAYCTLKPDLRFQQLSKIDNVCKKIA